MECVKEWDQLPSLASAIAGPRQGKKQPAIDESRRVKHDAEVDKFGPWGL